MRITISFFRIYKEKVVYDFSDGKITLLSGNSGSGKSTIFQAIYWCLYSGMQHISPKNTNEGKGRNYVKIEMKNMIIERTKPPNTLKITFSNNDDIYIDDSAQEYIKQFFGSKELWCTSSYIIQDEKSPLITLSNSKKFELLQELTFGDTSELSENKTPEYYYQKIDSELIEVKETIKTDTSEYNGFNDACKSLENNMEKAYENWGEKPRRTKELNKIKSQIRDLEENLVSKKRSYEEAFKLENLNENVENNVVKLKNKLKKLENENKDVNIDELFEKCKLIELIEERDKLFFIKNVNYDFGTLIKWKSVYEEFKLFEIEEIKKNCENRLKWKKWEYQEFLKYKKLKIEYEESEEEKKKLDSLEKYEKFLENVDLMKIYEKTKELEKWKKYEKLKIEYENSKTEEKKIEENNKLENFLISKELKVRNKNIEIKEKYDEEVEIHEKSMEWKKNSEINETYEKYEKDLKEYNFKKEKIENLTYIYKLELEKYNLWRKSKKKYDAHILKIKELEKSYDPLPMDIDEEINNLEMSLREIYCPFCEKGLKFSSTNNCLLKGTTSLEEKEKNKEKLEILKKMKKLKLNIPEELEISEKPKDLDLDDLDDEPEKPLFKKIEKIIKPEILNFNDVKKVEYFEENTNIKIPKNFIDKHYDEPKITEKYIVNEYFIKTFEISYEEIIYVLNDIPEEIKMGEYVHINNLEKKIKKLENELKYEIKNPNVGKINLEKIKKFSLSYEEIIEKLSSFPSNLDEIELDEEINEEPEKGINISDDNIPLINKCDVVNNINSLKNKNQYEKLDEEIKKIKIKINDDDFLEILKKDILKYKDNKSNIKLIKDEINESKIFPIEIPSIEIKKEINAIEEEIVKLNELVIDGRNVINLEKQKINLENKRIKLIDDAKYEGNLNKLRKIITETSTLAMEDILENINNNANIYLSELFEEKEVYLSLNTHKLLKKGDNKLQVNLEFEYDGETFDNMNELSGGEQRRISFALTLAVAKVIGTPFIMLDECMSSLNGELRDKCLKILKKYFSHLTVINICHEIIEGLHDEVVFIN